MMMSSGSDKTEEPTSYRMEKARNDGNIAKSADFNAGLLVACVLLLFTIGQTFGLSTIEAVMRKALTLTVKGPFTLTTLAQLVQEFGQVTMLLLLPFLGGLFVVTLGSQLWQVGPLFTTKPLMPNFGKLNPIQGAKRFFSLKSTVELGKGVLKLIVVGIVAYSLLSGFIPEMGRLSYATPAQLLSGIAGHIQQVMMAMAIAFMAIGFADLQYQKWQHRKNLRMTKQEVKDENKNMQGDLAMRGKIRQFGQKMIFNKQIKLVPQADVIITNPTHYAIALRYDPDVAPAPHVLAKGLDHNALRIREVAKQHGIEMVENRPLAHSLYDKVSPGEMIPPELFVAVAEVLAYVYKKRGGRR